MNIRETIPYGIKIATGQGGLNKAVTRIQIAPLEGSINKDIIGIQVAPLQGSINKRIFIGGGLLGDVNNDGEISISDYTLVRLHLLELSLLTQEEQNRADVDCDGECTESDYDLIREYLLEL